MIMWLTAGESIMVMCYSLKESLKLIFRHWDNRKYQEIVTPQRGVYQGSEVNYFFFYNLACKVQRKQKGPRQSQSGV